MDMTFLVKFLFFSAFIAVGYGRSLFGESVRNLQGLDANCSCDWRYFNHYETKGCLVETSDSCGCPEKFLCPNQTEQTSAKVCTYQNKEYTVGSKIISSDICQVCRCRDGVPPYISCVTRECPQIHHNSGPDCHPVYKENKCCPVGIECVGNEIELTSNKTCEYDGRLYPFGAKIYPVDDPCKTCICNENWKDSDSSNCYQHDCMFEKNKSKLDAGCIPVYHESRCCPVEFYCPSNHLSNSALSSNGSSDNYNISNENQCTFAGQFYALGEELFIGNPCVKCTCVVYPDFTCVHQTCPPSPSEESCYAVFNSGECCPTYECMLGDEESHSVVCPTPICADSTCRIETPIGHDCPTCVCEENNSELEHNNLEQVQQHSLNIEQEQVQQHNPNIEQEQVQQLSQNIEQEQVEQLFRSTVDSSATSSEDELQIMPKRSQYSEKLKEQQLSILDKMIQQEFDNIDQYSEGLRELEESSFEDNYSTEAEGIHPTDEDIQTAEGDIHTAEGDIHTAEENTEDIHTTEEDIEDIHTAEDKNSTSLPELDLVETYNKSISEESEKVVQKRSDASHVAFNDQTEVNPIQQHELGEDIEREGAESDGKSTDFADELESFKNKMFNKNKTIINEIIKIDHVVKVPPGCPTPMCEGPWCKIGIPPGDKCPTCICKRRTENEP